MALYILVSGISTVHVVDFFRLSNPGWLAITLAIAFEIGAAACLAAIVILDKTSRWMVWTLFFIITAMQCCGNMYYCYSHLADIRNWVELFGLAEQEPMLQKRIMSIISGATLPIVALGFIKSLVDYIRPSRPIPIEPLIKVEEAEAKKEDEVESPKPESANPNPTPPTASGADPDVPVQQPGPDTYVEPVPPPRFGPM